MLQELITESYLYRNWDYVSKSPSIFAENRENVLRSCKPFTKEQVNDILALVDNLIDKNIWNQVMGDSKYKAHQSSVSLPMIKRYVEMIIVENKFPPPDIMVDDGVIIEGHHRYVAAKIVGWENDLNERPCIAKKMNSIREWSEVKVDTLDWNF